MKHTYIKWMALLFAAAMLVSLASCKDAQGDNTTTPTETTTPQENPPVLKEVWLPYTMRDYAEKCTYTIYYDDYGNQIVREKKADNGTVSTWLYEYDHNNNLTKITLIGQDNEPFVQRVQTYDEAGKLIRRQDYYANGEAVYTYEYDEQGRILAEQRNGTLSATYIYYEDGSYRVLQNVAGLPYEIYTIFDKDGKTLESVSAPDTKTVHLYDENGNLTEAVFYSGDEINFRLVHERDEHGNIIKATQISDYGEQVMNEYTYKLYTVKER